MSMKALRNAHEQLQQEYLARLGAEHKAHQLEQENAKLREALAIAEQKLHDLVINNLDHFTDQVLLDGVDTPTSPEQGDGDR